MSTEIKARANFRVYVEDTDYMGIVYHANYLKYLERARTEFLRNQGLSLTKAKIEDTLFAIKSLTIDFNAILKLDDIAEVTTKVTQQRPTLLFFEQDIHCNSKLIANAKISVVCVNNKLKPKKVPINILP